MEIGFGQLLKFLLFGGAGLCAIVAAYFQYLDSAQDKDSRRRTKERYDRIWSTIRSTGILLLPERVIGWSLRQFHKLSDDPAVLFSDKLVILAVLLAPIITFVVNYIDSGFWIAFGLSIPILVPIVIFKYYRQRERTLLVSFLGFVFGIIGFCCWIYSWIIGMGVIVTLDLKIVAPIMVLSLPIGTIFLAIPMSLLAVPIDKIYNKKWYELSATIAIGFVVSSAVTMMAMLLGSYMSPIAPIPQTLQMLLSNMICDGLTLGVTLGVLTWALKNATGLRILVAVVLDVLVAAFLACCSLYFGLLSTPEALSAIDLLNLLVINPFSPGLESYDPYFWVMHTAFLPTLIYLLLVLLAWCGKIIVLPIADLFQKGKVAEKPLQTTALYFGVLVAILLFLGLIVSTVFDMYPTQLV